jgi:hypothetical protein
MAATIAGSIGGRGRLVLARRTATIAATAIAGPATLNPSRMAPIINPLRRASPARCLDNGVEHRDAHMEIAASSRPRSAVLPVKSFAR